MCFLSVICTFDNAGAGWSPCNALSFAKLRSNLATEGNRRRWICWSLSYLLERHAGEDRGRQGWQGGYRERTSEISLIDLKNTAVPGLRRFLSPWFFGTNTCRISTAMGSSSGRGLHSRRTSPLSWWNFFEVWQSSYFANGWSRH